MYGAKYLGRNRHAPKTSAGAGGGGAGGGRVMGIGERDGKGCCQKVWRHLFHSFSETKIYFIIRTYC